MGIHYLISSSSKSLQLHWCYLARILPTLLKAWPHPSQEKELKAFPRSSRHTAQRGTWLPRREHRIICQGTTWAQISAGTGKLGLTNPMLQLNQLQPPTKLSPHLLSMLAPALLHSSLFQSYSFVFNYRHSVSAGTLVVHQGKSSTVLIRVLDKPHFSSPDWSSPP